MSAAKYEAFLSHFCIAKRRGNKVQAYCPAHQDDNASLSITLAGDKILLFCHAGCMPDAVLSAVSLKLADLFLDDRRSPESIFQYRNADGSLLYEKLKYRLRSGKKQLASEGIGSKAIATKLNSEHGIKVSYKTIQRVLSGERKQLMLPV